MAQLRPGDYGLTVALEEIPQIAAITEGEIELWGVPADHQEGAVSSRQPFLTTPTLCGPMTLAFRTRSWQEGAPWLSATTASAPLEGCQNLPFEPRLGFVLTNPVADAATGIQANLTFPEYNDPDGLVGSQTKAVDIRMPEGMSVSPAGAEGLGVCTDAQFGFGVAGESSCPSSSKVGSVLIESPQAREPLSGGVYLGQERPGERFRLFVAATAPGVEVKLAGSLKVDPESGQLTANLSGLPQFPMTRIALSLDGGSRSLLATPLNCGPATATASLEPYSAGSQVESSAQVTIGAHTPGSHCSGAPFAPQMVTGSTNLLAGHQTSFSMTLSRQPGEQVPDRFKVELPPGLSPALGTVELCGAADAAAGTCPAASKIGSAVAEVGSGPEPATIEGAVYLTGPYRGAPFGLALVFHALIGPFDLGNLVVRGKVEVDSLSGQATIETDALPEAFEGIPLRFQTIGLDLNRQGFVRNPTSCAPTNISATIQTKSGASSVSTTPFALKGCNALRFRPTFSMALAGRSQLRRHGRPGLRLSARLPKGDTDLRTVEVSLPHLLQFDISGLREICARVDAMDGRCPQGSRVGTSVARTPLFSQQLRGPVYVVQPQGDGSPDLWASIEGAGVPLNFQSETSANNRRATVTLAHLPDIPLSALTMRLDGGDDGILSLRSGPCSDGHLRQIFSPLAVEGQDGAHRQMQVRLAAKGGCGAKGLSRPTVHAQRLARG